MMLNALKPKAPLPEHLYRSTTSEALAYIIKLYHIENETKEVGIIGDALKDERQKESIS